MGSERGFYGYLTNLSNNLAMRINFNLFPVLLIWIVATPFAFSQSIKGGTTLNNPIAKYTDTKQLDSLFSDFGDLLIINQRIYTIPCECLSCLDRNSGQQSLARLYGHQLISDRMLSGIYADRELSMNYLHRFYGDDLNKDRILMGELYRRDGDMDDMYRLYGMNYQDLRNLQGKLIDRNDGMDNSLRLFGNYLLTKRTIFGTSNIRDKGGNVMYLTCKKGCGRKFVLKGIKKNTEVLFFNGKNLVKIKNGKIKY